MSYYTEKILEILQEQAEFTVALHTAFLADKQTSRKRLWRLATYGPKKFKKNWAEAYRERQRFSTLLNHLKREGLIKKQNNNKRSAWYITKAGRKKYALMQERNKNNLFSAAYIDFAPLMGGGTTIITFDVPERDRKKRDWLRAALLEMGCQLLQKSVWIGKGSVDEKFIHALQERGMVDYVHIFSIDRKGTMHEI